MVIGSVVSEILGGGGTTPHMLLHCQKEQMLLTVKEKCPYVLKAIGKFSNDIACFVENEGKVCFNGGGLILSGDANNINVINLIKKKGKTLIRLYMQTLSG